MGNGVPSGVSGAATVRVAVEGGVTDATADVEGVVEDDPVKLGSGVRVVVMERAGVPLGSRLAVPDDETVDEALLDIDGLVDTDEVGVRDGVSTGMIARTALLSRSAMKMAPLPLTATPVGQLSRANTPGPLLPEFPLVPFPTIVMMVPVAAFTARMRCEDVSAGS